MHLWDRNKEDRIEEGSNVESSKFQARSLQKEIEQKVFAKHAHHEEITRWHVDDSCDLDRIRKPMHARSKHRLKKPRSTRDGFENRFQGRHFAYQISSKSSPRRSGAPLERSSRSRSAPGMRSGRSGDAPGMFRACSGVLPGRAQDAFGASWVISGCHGSTFSPNSLAFPRNVVSGLVFSNFLSFLNVLARIVFSFFRSFFWVSFR